MRTYNEYYVDLKVRTFQESQGNITTEEGALYFGIRLQTLLISQEFLYRRLGFRLLSEIQTKFATLGKIPTILNISNFNDACRLGLLRELSFTLVPKDPEKVVYPFNSRYNSNLPYSVDLPIRYIIESLYNQTFVFGENDVTAEYMIEPNSIREKKQKKTTPRFSNS